jgi:glutathione S-transferase
MQPPFRLYGAEHSAFSQKLLTYLRFKGLEHEYVIRTADNAAEFSRLARLPLIPLLVEADGRTAQDSTMILDRLEQAHAAPCARPDEPALQFLSALLEDFADEWLHKIGLFYRWAEEADAALAARAIVHALYGEAAPEGAADVITARMVAKLPVAGASAANGPALEAALADLLSLLDAHLMPRAYLLGATPCAADFAMAAQLAQMQKDARSAARIAAFPFVSAYVTRMAAPAAGDAPAFESLDSLRATLEPLLLRHVGEVYLAFAQANVAAQANGGAIALTVFDQPFAQSAQRYAGRAFQELRRKRAAVSEHPGLSDLLAAAACDAALAPPTGPQAALEAGEDDPDGGDDEEQGED